MAMPQLHVRRGIAAPPERAWSPLVDVAQWPRWGPSVAGAEVAGRPDGVIVAGSRGRVRTAVGVWLPFEVTSFEPGRRWAWSVAGVPATSHEVRPTSDGCEVVLGVPLWAPAYLAVCALALRRIEAIAVGG